MCTATITPSIASKSTIADGNGGLRQRRRQDTVLIIDKINVLNGQATTLGANTGAVAVWDAGACEREVADGDIVRIGYDERLPTAGFVCEDGLALTGTFDGEAGCTNEGTVKILSGGDEDMITLVGSGDSL